MSGGGRGVRRVVRAPAPCFSGFAVVAALGLIITASVGTFKFVGLLSLLPFFTAWFIAVLRLVVSDVSILWAATGTILNVGAVIFAFWASELPSGNTRHHPALLAVLVAAALAGGSASMWSQWIAVIERGINARLANYFGVPADFPLPRAAKWGMISLAAAVAVAYGYGAYSSDWFVAFFPLAVVLVVITYRAVMDDKSLTADGVVLLSSVPFAIGVFHVTGASFTGGVSGGLLATASVVFAVLGAVASLRVG